MAGFQEYGLKEHSLRSFFASLEAQAHILIALGFAQTSSIIVRAHGGA
jgi:hypothetical protein